MTSTSKLSAWATHMVYLRAARTFLTACEEAGIPALPVKGIVTAHTLYDDPAERPTRDVDVRIRPEDYPRVGDLARKRGWRFIEVKHAYRNYVLDVDAVQIDVECHVGPPHVCALRVKEMIGRARRDESLGFPALLPDFTDHAVLLVVNVFKDKLALARDAALEDVARLAGKPAFAPQTLAARLTDAHAATIGWIVADYFGRERRIAKWADVRNALGPLHRPRYERALQFARRRPTGAGSVLLARISSDDALERVRALLTMVRWVALERRRP